MEKENSNLREEFKKVFSKAYGRNLTNAEVEEIILNLSGLFNLLNRFKKNDLEEKNKIENKHGI